MFISNTYITGNNVWPGYCHLKSEVSALNCHVDVVMLCFGLMLHPPPIYQSQSQ